MRVLFAGTPGGCKTDVLNRLKGCIEDSEEFGRRQRVFAHVFEHPLYGEDAKTFLEQSNRDQADAWEDAFKQFRKDEAAAKTDHTFLGVHLIYRHDQFPTCAISFSDLIRWKPHCIVTLIDDAFCVRHRIHKGGYESFTLGELVLWRGEELLIGDVLAKLVNRGKPIPNFLLAIKHPTTMLARLLASVRGNTGVKRETGRVYLSYHISETRNSADRRAIIDKFRGKTRLDKHAKNLAVFDPLAIDELPLVELARKTKGKTVTYKVHHPPHRWPLLRPNQLLVSDGKIPDEMRIPTQEIKAAANGIKTQVAQRDLRLVEQSHAVCAYRPTLAKLKPGSGVLAEVLHANKIGRAVIQYIKKGEEEEPGSTFFPRGGPGHFFEKTETSFWKWFAQVHLRCRDLDAFLRSKVG